MCYAHGIYLAVTDRLKLKSLDTEISSSEILFQDEIDAEEPDDENGLQFHVTLSLYKHLQDRLDNW